MLVDEPFYCFILKFNRVFVIFQFWQIEVGTRLDIVTPTSRFVALYVFV